MTATAISKPPASPFVARVLAAIAKQGDPASLSSLDAMEARLGRETDPVAIVTLAREIDAIKSNQGTPAPQSSLEVMEARLGRETDPVAIVALAREIDAMKSKQAQAR